MSFSKSLRLHSAPLICLLLVAVALLVPGFGGYAMAEQGGTHEMHEVAAAGAHGENSAPAGHEAQHAEHHGLTPEALPVFQVGPFVVTNSMILTWVAALFIIMFARIATRRIQQVPDGAQNFWEWMVESLHNFLDEIIGHKLAHKTFWFFATIFILILFTNWFGLIPGVGTVGWGESTPGGGIAHVSQPVLRGGNADLNMTLAMAVIFFVCWTIWALQANGFGGVIVHLFGNPARKEMTGVLAILMAAVFLVVGTLEVISILFRPVSLSFRLYGNIFAGENLLESMAALVPWLGWLIPIPFYFMELLVGLVQALVFMLLTAVFTLLICSHGDDHGGEHH